MGSTFSTDVQTILLRGDLYDPIIHRVKIPISATFLNGSYYSCPATGNVVLTLANCWLSLLIKWNCCELIERPIDGTELLVRYGNSSRSSIVLEGDYMKRQQTNMFWFIYLYCTYFPVFSFLPIFFVKETEGTNSFIPQAQLLSVAPLYSLRSLYVHVKKMQEEMQLLDGIVNTLQIPVTEPAQVNWMHHLLNKTAFLELGYKALHAVEKMAQYEETKESIYNLELQDYFQPTPLQVPVQACLLQFIRSQLCDSRVEHLFNLSHRTYVDETLDSLGGFSGRVSAASARNVVFVLEVMEKVILPAQTFWEFCLSYRKDPVLLPVNKDMLERMKMTYDHVKAIEQGFETDEVNFFHMAVYSKMLKTKYFDQ
jgi:hypothetical protein